ncbi:hypothetical protein ERO13_D05G025600v2 [Gossypium hirsutum]|uniref:Protein CONTINUOUS VASCULAR RING 1 isoform X2 n=2 Tax=Gossypium TaxID=3633 RepID=A0A1U8JI66_GOSHI|nr:protein CONTINUOUS VASCULAR RING 1-like isoform X2 [Gossypium hirsutum]KAG4144244.1 hypothetical protein ERO13_D05G025600v2 [Gossypium hirsutum]TYG66779.1 hypothetical protein ES288_D05G027200v1 [Gossypium darwinii]
MGDDKSTIVMGSRDLELLIPVADSVHDDSSKHSASFAPSHHSGRETFYKVFQSWASKKFMTGCVILFPIAITFYVTWWFIHFVDGFFSPIFLQLGINVFGLGFVTSITFIFVIGVFMSSWLGASVLGLGEWFIKRMPFVRHIYNASKQISSAISPDQSSQAFKEVAIIKHPRIGEYAFGFITSSVTLQHHRWHDLIGVLHALHFLSTKCISSLGKRSYVASMFPQIIFTLAIYSSLIPRMLSDRIYQFVKELKS